VNGTSAERRALTWLIHEDSLYNASALMMLSSQHEDEISFRVGQQFVLATHWFQQVDETLSILRKTHRVGCKFKANVIVLVFIVTPMDL
jgi:hypothetical protein